MKRKFAIIGLLLTLSIIGTTFVYAYPDYLPEEPDIELPDAIANTPGTIWMFNTQEQFSGKDIETINAVYWISTDFTFPTPKKIIKLNHMIILLFETSEVAEEVDTEGRAIWGYTSGGDLVFTTGPGFARRRVTGGGG